MADMIQALDKIVEAGSELWLFNSIPVVARMELLKDKGHKGTLNLENLQVKNAYGNPVLRSNLLVIKSLDEFGDVTGEEVPLVAFQSTLILADEAKQEESGIVIDRPGVKAIGSQNPSDHRALSTDGRTLATFLLVCDVRKGQLLEAALASEALASGQHLNSKKKEDIEDPGRERIIIEILDAANTKSLLTQLECTGYVLSNRLVSDLIAQVTQTLKPKL